MLCQVVGGALIDGAGRWQEVLCQVVGGGGRGLNRWCWEVAGGALSGGGRWWEGP